MISTLSTIYLQHPSTIKDGNIVQFLVCLLALFYYFYRDYSLKKQQHFFKYAAFLLAFFTFNVKFSEVKLETKKDNFILKNLLKLSSIGILT